MKNDNQIRIDADGIKPANKIKNSVRIAVSGITVALGLVILLAAYLFDSLTYALPMLAGGILIIPVSEFGEKNAFSIYISTAILAFILCHKEAALMYLFLFGLYPVIQFLFERLTNKWLRRICKLLYFNISAVIAVSLALYIFGVPILEDGVGSWMYAVMLLVANVAFVLYDIALYKFAYIYDMRFSQRFQKLFKNH